jgi:hypothetical protein
VRLRHVVLILALCVGCSTPDSNAETPIAAPDRSSFDPVSTYVEHRCGTLDCHGTRYRNLRIWGQDGMRLTVGDVPGGTQTSTAEIDATYQAVIELEPEILAQVVKDRGANPERLTLVRKVRGLEKHTGGTIMAAGDERDRCIVSWLSGATDASACSDALALP